MLRLSWLGAREVGRHIATTSSEDRGNDIDLGFEVDDAKDISINGGTPTHLYIQTNKVKQSTTITVLGATKDATKKRHTNSKLDNVNGASRRRKGCGRGKGRVGWRYTLWWG